MRNFAEFSPPVQYRFLQNIKNVMLILEVLNVHGRIIIFPYIHTPAVAFAAMFVWMKQGCSVPPAALNKGISLCLAWWLTVAVEREVQGFPCICKFFHG